MVIDAHQHFWELGRFDTAWLESPQHIPINRNFLPEDLRPLLDSAGVDRSVFVQTQHTLEENRWALWLTEQHPWICGVVGWVDLASDECEQQLEEFTSHEKFVGIRHITQDEPDDDFIVRPEIIRGLKVLQKREIPFDLLFYVRHLKHAATLGRQLPDLPMVVDHLAKPQIKAANIAGWTEDLKAAAACPNIFCKLSGMVTEADWKNWKPADLKPYVETALDAFGPDRLMYGSDWPVCKLAASYQQVIDALREIVGPLSETEKAKIFGETATKFYGLKV